MKTTNPEEAISAVGRSRAIGAEPINFIDDFAVISGCASLQDPSRERI